MPAPSTCRSQALRITDRIGAIIHDLATLPYANRTELQSEILQLTRELREMLYDCADHIDQLLHEKLQEIPRSAKFPQKQSGPTSGKR